MPNDPTTEQKAFADTLLILFRQGHTLPRLKEELADRIMEYDELRNSQIRTLRRQVAKARAGLCPGCGNLARLCECAVGRKAMGASGG